MSQNPIAVPFDSFQDIKAAIESTLDEVRELSTAPNSRTYAITTNLNCVLMLLAKAEENKPEVAKKFDHSMVDSMSSHSNELESKISKMHSEVSILSNEQDEQKPIDDEWLAEYRRARRNKQNAECRARLKRDNPEKHYANRKAVQIKKKAYVANLKIEDPVKYAAYMNTHRLNSLRYLNKKKQISEAEASTNQQSIFDAVDVVKTQAN